MNTNQKRDSRGRYTTNKPLIVSEQGISVDPRAESVDKLPVVSASEMTTVTIFDLDGNIEVQDVYSSFPPACADALEYMEGGFTKLSLGEVMDYLPKTDVAYAPIGWTIFDSSVEEVEGELDEEPYAEMLIVEDCINRDAKRDCYARAVAAVASMSPELKSSKRVKGLLYLVESRTGATATEAGLLQAERAADELEAIAVS
jgi:hypothetical protein